MKDIDLARTLTVRITSQEERDALKTIVRETGCKQLSKALLRCAEGYVRLCDMTQKQSAEIRRLSLENERLRRYAQIIASASAAMQTMEQTTAAPPTVSEEQPVEDIPPAPEIPEVRL